MQYYTILQHSILDRQARNEVAVSPALSNEADEVASPGSIVYCIVVYCSIV